MDAVEQLGVFLGDGVLKRKIEQTLEEAFSFGHVGCLQNMRCIRHSFPPKFGMSSLGALSLSLAPNGWSEKLLHPLPLPNWLCFSAGLAGITVGAARLRNRSMRHLAESSIDCILPAHRSITSI